MARAYEGILGPVVGKVGTVVGYLWRGKPVLRAYVRHIHFPNTERQLAERDWFISMVRFASATRPALRLGLGENAGRSLMTEGNYFVMRNKRHFHHVGNQYDGTSRIDVDYARLALSEGPVAGVEPAAITVDDDGILTAKFHKNNALPRSRPSDRVHLFIYNPAVRRGVLAAPVRRSQGRSALRLPDGWQAAPLHCYLFATDAQGHASPTAYAPVAPAADTAQTGSTPLAPSSLHQPTAPAPDKADEAEEKGVPKRHTERTLAADIGSRGVPAAG